MDPRLRGGDNPPTNARSFPRKASPRANGGGNPPFLQPALLTLAGLYSCSRSATAIVQSLELAFAGKFWHTSCQVQFPACLGHDP